MRTLSPSSELDEWSEMLESSLTESSERCNHGAAGSTRANPLFAAARCACAAAATSCFDRAA